MDITRSSWQDLPERVPGAFELILCLGNSLVHTATKSAMISSLEGIKQVLSPGGVLVIDSRNWEYLYESRPRIITRRAIERQAFYACNPARELLSRHGDGIELHVGKSVPTEHG